MKEKNKFLNYKDRLEAIPVDEIREIPHNGKKWLRCHLIGLANKNGMAIRTKIHGNNILVWRIR